MTAPEKRESSKGLEMEAREAEVMLEVRLLGVPRILRQGEPITLSRRKAEALLYFLISDQHAHARDKLATLLWEKFDDVRARRNLSNAITVLRKALGTSSEGRSYILAEGGTLRFNTATDYRLDVAVFERLVDTALKEVREQAVSLPNTCTRLEQAVNLYRGDFLGSTQNCGVKTGLEANLS